ncbi:MAG TPA: benzoylformate decarboxylase [Candidatus Acidoferrales bacterium]|nr:benzoylformate decarboxylase [Candidatus Acidoferrales bacterium]
METKPTVREATLALLRSLRITTVFGNPGSTELGLLRDWPEDFRYILALNEASAVAMADGYAQASGRPALASLHSAGGLGHALGSVMTAWWNQTPVVIIAGQQTRALLPLMPYLHDLEAAQFPRPYVKWSAEPARAEDVPAAIARACYTAIQRPCGPTFVSVPADDWEAPTDPLEPREVATEFAPDPDALARVAAALDASRRPALVVGPGVDRDGAWDLAIELACRTRAAVWVSPYSSRCSFPEDHPLFAGFLPAARQPLCRKLDGHDVIVVLGAPVFTFHIHTEGPVIPPGARLFQLVDDPAAAAWAPAGASVLCTMRLGLAHLVERVAASARPTPPGLRRPPAPAAADPITAAFVLHAVGAAMPGDAIIVDEVPSHRPLLHDYLPIRSSGGFYAGASGSLGWGLPAAAGISLAQPGRRVICVVGDGSAQYAIQGLWTAAQHHMPITFVIFNNGGYAALDAFSALTGAKSHPSFQLPGIDVGVIAAGYGCAARRVEWAAELGPALEASFQAAGPTLLDIPIKDSAPSLF